MAYNLEIEEKINSVVARWPGITSKKMFGGVGIMMNGNMLVGAHGEYLILMLSQQGYAEVMGLPFSKPFDITGRPMKGWAMVEGSKISQADYEYWILKAKEFVKTLPVK